MPYIDPDLRDALRPVAPSEPTSAGELNFQITTLVLDYIAKHGASYKTFNDAIGALECAKFELYMRRIRAYEDAKIAENGDVY